jgi:ornithine carbamoyltransferase
MKRDLISIQDLSCDDVSQLINLTAQLKEYKGRSSDYLAGKNIGLLFQKPSNRTRVSFEVGISQLGGNCIYLGPKEINLGVRESTTDVSRTLSRYLDGIVARTHTHQDIVKLTKSADIPVINGLSDVYHPCQGLTDIFSIKERFGELKGLTVAYVGDGNNVCHSLLLACAKTGVNMNIATPQGYLPEAQIIKSAEESAKETGATITLSNSPKDAVKGANAIYADVWVSMGQEEESQKRLADFKEYQINEELVKSADKDYIFMHCLPAHRGQEVTAGIIDDKEHSIIFDQAENRLHTQKAIMIFLIGEKDKT